MTKCALAALAMLACGCDVVFGVAAVPDAQPNLLGCTTQDALICADFEEDHTFYIDGLARDIPPEVANQMVSIGSPGVHGGHALYITSMGPTYRLEGMGQTPASKITATFDIVFAEFDATTPATGVALLFFVNSSCYVAIDFQPTGFRLNLVSSCGTAQSVDIVAPLPARTSFVPVTFTIDLANKVGTVQLDASKVMVPISPGVMTAIPAAAFGFIDKVDGSTASVGIDDLLVTTQ